MIRKLLLLCALVAIFPVFAQAQDDDSRGEFFIGYSVLQADTTVSNEDVDLSSFNFTNNDRIRYNGVNAAGTGYITRRFGITGDFSFHQKSQDFTLPSSTIIGTGGNFSVRDQVYTLLAGPQYKFKNSSRVEPFVRAMAGIAHSRTRLNSGNLTLGNSAENFAGQLFNDSTTDFALGIGGGLDVKVSDRIAIRAIQVDYTPVFERDRTITVGNTNDTISGARADNVRFSFGVVFK